MRNHEHEGAQRGETTAPPAARGQGAEALAGLRVETLGQAGDLVLQRGFLPASRATVLIAAATREPTAQMVEQLEHGLDVSRELDPAHFVRARSIEPLHGRMALVMDDPGGQLLGAMLGRPLAPGLALLIGAEVAASLEAFHARSFVHRDLKPAHLLVDLSAPRVRIAGFGMSLQLSRHRQAPDASDLVVGTAAYMAPEQSGWTNRSLDARADLYALGVILYEMFTGQLPFAADDLAGWVHCHVARPPVPPVERVASLPVLVSDLILRLLAKNPEDRYQTARGVEADLRECLRQLEVTGSIEPFVLGEQDISPHLLIPEKLYGREREVAHLLASFDRVVTSSAPGMVLVAGYSGIGKSSVVRELQRELVPHRGRFVGGKCDQYKRDIPYSTLAQALRKLVAPLLGASEGEVDLWRERLSSAVGPGLRLVVDLVPELALVVGELPPLPTLPPQETQVRFQTAMRAFLGVFARREHPLVVFLDDLQWLDAATLDLVESLLGHPEMGALLLVGAYRDNEIGPAHPLHGRLERLRGGGEAGRELVLGPLGLEDVTALVADAVRASAERAGPLAAVVHDRTGGNPFFTVQLLTALHDEGLLTFDPPSLAWRWDAAQIVAQGFTDSIVELMVGKIGRLSAATGRVLGALACLGALGTPGRLGEVWGTAEEEVHVALEEALRAGLLVRSERGAHAFVHDRVQEAAYAQIPPAERPAVHLRIGRRLLAATPPEQRVAMVFEIVNQLNRGAGLMTSAAERQELAALDVAAGHRARAGSAHDSARAYFAQALELLGEEGWESQRDLAFDAAFHRAEGEFLTGASPAAEAHLEALAPRARDLVEDANIVCLRVAIGTSLGRYEHALSVGLPYLSRAGLAWPAEPSPEDIGRELERVREQVGDGPVQRFAELPAMTDPARIAAMDVLAALIPTAMFHGSSAYGLLLGRAVNLSLEFGLCDASPMPLAVFGLLLMHVTRRHDAGRDWAELGLAVVEKRGFGRSRAKVLVTAGHILPWVRELPIESELGARALQAGMETGDVVFASYGFCQMTRNALARGAPLASTETLIVSAVAFAERVADGMTTCFLSQLNAVRSLRGGPLEFGPYPSEEAMEAFLDADPAFTMIVELNQVRKLERSVYLGDVAEAVRSARRAEVATLNGTFYFEYAELQFYGAIARAMHHDEAPEGERPALVEAIVEHVRVLGEWAATWAPTFAHRHQLAAAELARVEGRHWEAQGLYRQAIESARAHGWVHHEALAHERAARFFLAHGLEPSARAHFRRAHAGYVQWGAVAKARSLEPLLEGTEGARDPSTLASIKAPVEHLDLGTVLKVSAALSGEIVLERLVRQLLAIAVEHAGAERALLVMLHEGSPRIEAEALASNDGIEVLPHRAPALPPALPEAVLRYVLRTRQPLVLTEPAAFEPFLADPYVRAVAPRSVIVLPLLKQGELGGVLYLENRQAAGAYRAARLSVLTLVAAQAAIALDNARLYEELRAALDAINRSEEQLRTTIDAIPAMVWFNRSDGQNEFQSEVWRRYTGLTKEQSDGLAWLAAIHRDDLGSMMEVWQQLLTSGEPGEVEARVRRHDGLYRWFLFRAQPMRDAQGVIQKWYGTTLDIDDLKQSQAALVSLQAQLAHVSRVASLGELTASIAHEVNQPLGAVVANASAALRWLDRGPPDLVEGRAALDRIRRDASRMKDIITRLRSLFMRGGGSREPLDLNEAIAEMIAFTRPEATKSSVAVQTALAEGLPAVKGDRVQLQQVVLNLLGNAIQAMGEVTRERELWVRTRAVGGDVRVSVADTGPGFEGGQVERLFESFQTTKPGGMGMGLSISRSIVEAHGGRIWAETGEHGGATFHFSLPAAP